MALINSALAMKYTIAAVSCMIDKNTRELIMDPEESQLNNSKASFTFVFDSIKKGLVSTHTTGRFTEKEFLDAVDKSREASQHVFDFFRSIVKKYAYIL